MVKETKKLTFIIGVITIAKSQPFIVIIVSVTGSFIAYFKCLRDAFRIIEFEFMDQNRWCKGIFGKEFDFLFCQFTILSVIQNNMTDFMHDGVIYTPIVFFIVVEYVPLSVCLFYRKAIFTFLDRETTLVWSDG